MRSRVVPITVAVGTVLVAAACDGNQHPTAFERSPGPMISASSSSAQSGQTYDAAGDFSATTNPTGPWSYGWRNVTTNFTLSTVAGVSGALNTWRPAGAGFFDRMVYHNPTGLPAGFCTDWCVEPGHLAMHPGSALNNDVVVRFTAPAAADHDVNVTFSPIDRQSNSIKVWVLVNGSQVATGSLTTFGTTVSYTGTHSLAAGGTIDFVVGNAGFWGNDGTDLDAVVTALPSNQDPTVSPDNASVTVNEGVTANNTGTVSDPDGNTVTLTASVGTVTNNNNGTWSWSFGTTDGPSQSQTVTIGADDGNGGTDQTSFSLTVNNVAPTVNAVTVPIDPVSIGAQPVSASASFSDPAGTADESYTCTVDYNDASGPQPGTVAGTVCTGPAHSYAQPGVYNVTVAVTDKDGGSGSLTAETMIVIYDPSGGFVTGGGWIYSGPGAYKPAPTLEGKANFGFVSKYKKGASVPTGNTEFQFKAGNLNFHSSSYDWLVVNQNNTRAQYKGAGTINGQPAPNGAYKFMLWANDLNPATDTFRIKIWWENVDGAEVVVYDNGVDQPIGGGSIQIHK